MKSQKSNLKNQKYTPRVLASSKRRSTKVKSFEFYVVILTFGLCLLTLVGKAAAPTRAIAIEKTNQKTTQLLRISPVIVPLKLLPGKTISVKASVENLTDAPLPLRTLLSDFEPATEDGGYVFLETKTNPLLSWIQLSQTEFILPAKTKKTITLTIQIPNHIPVGGYFGLLFFEPVLTQTQKDTVIATRVGMLMLANIGVGSAEPAQILTFSVGSFFNETGALPLLLRVKNTSLNFFSAKPRLILTPLFGRSQTIPLEEKFVFPAKVRRWEEKDLLQNLSLGLYRARVRVSTGNGQEEVTEQLFLVFPLMRLTIAISILLLLTIGIRKRKRIQKSLTILLRGNA